VVILICLSATHVRITTLVARVVQVARGAVTEQTEAGRIEHLVRSAFADGEIERVAVLEYGDDPEVGPGETAVRVFINLASQPKDKSGHADLHAFHEARLEAINKVRKELRPVAWWVEYCPAGKAIARPGGPAFRSLLRDEEPGDVAGELTPVMTRLGPADLATVDTLITAGIATSRAEVLRWAVARIREHPAYVQIQQRVDEISELKARF
jgi:hypothetical protein